MLKDFSKSLVINANYKKTNSFTNKINMQQLISYFLVVFILLSFFLVIVPFIDGQRSRIIFFIFTVITILALIIFTYVCSTNDPTDPLILKQKIAAYQNEYFDIAELKFYCEDCDAYVQDDSKHCKRCDRCVHDFDHHCKWINNCIGVTNYRSFIAMIVSLLAFILIQIAACILAIITHIDDKLINLEEDTFINIYNLEKPQQEFILLVFLYIDTVFCFLILFLDFNLVMLHLFLFKKKMTTYQYILHTREQNEIKQKEQQRKKIEKQQLKIKKQQQKDKKEQQKLQKQVENLNLKKEQQQKQYQQNQQQASLEVTQIKNQIIPIENYNMNEVKQNYNKNNSKQSENNDSENKQEEEDGKIGELFQKKPERVQSALEKFQKSIDSNSSQYKNFKERYLSYSLMFTNQDILKIKQPKERINSESAYRYNNNYQEQKNIDLTNKNINKQNLHQMSDPSLGKDIQLQKASLFQQQQLQQLYQQQQKYQHQKMKSDKKIYDKPVLESLEEIESKVFEKSTDMKQKEIRFQK